MSEYRNDRVGPGGILATIVVIFVGIALLILLVIGIWWGFASFGRYNARADANNRVKISNIEIRNQAQRVTVAKQQAQIRFENSVGVREAQDEIAKTLTPLYVQFEMVQALQAIAASGKNNSVVYIPSGANGIPLVSTVNGTSVGQPDSASK